jgi:hypothetical protein
MRWVSAGALLKHCLGDAGRLSARSPAAPERRPLLGEAGRSRLAFSASRTHASACARRFRFLATAEPGAALRSGWHCAACLAPMPEKISSRARLP